MKKYIRRLWIIFIYPISFYVCAWAFISFVKLEIMPILLKVSKWDEFSRGIFFILMLLFLEIGICNYILFKNETKEK